MGRDTISVVRSGTSPIKIDTSVPALRSFDIEKLNTYRKNPAFNYAEDVVPTNWWQRFKHWLYNKLGNLLATKNSSTAFKWFFILIGVVALVFLVYKLLGMNMLHIFERNGQKGQGFLANEHENIYTIDFEKELQNAIESNNFKQAIRLLYLKSLRDLADRHYIDWQPGKTNQAYIQELKEKSFQHEFALLTNQFEYVWYGDFSLQKQHFTVIKTAFNTFNSGIK